MVTWTSVETDTARVIRVSGVCHVQLSVTPWTSPPGSSVHGILQARRQSGLPFLSPGDLPDPGIEPRSPALQTDPLPLEPPGKPVRPGLGA